MPKSTQEWPKLISIPLDLQKATAQRRQQVIVGRIKDYKRTHPDKNLILVAYKGRKNREYPKPYLPITITSVFRGILAKEFPNTYVISEEDYYDFGKFNPN
jgi:hypothetical protein